MRRELTSEERCLAAFEKWWPHNDEDMAVVDQIGQLNHDDWARLGWQACWRYLESRITEFIEN